MALPTLHIHEIPEEGLLLDASIGASWLAGTLSDTGFDPRGDPAGEARLRLDKRGRDVLLSGAVDVRLEAECVRCLARTPVDVHAEFTLNLVPAPTPTAEQGARGRAPEVELTADQLDLDVYDNDRVDLGRWVREQILLELPAHPACAAGCEPPAVASSAETHHAGIDPRLAPLQRLSKTKPSTTTKKKKE